MNLPGVRTALRPEQQQAAARQGSGGGGGGRRVHAPTLHERATIYLLLADVLGRLSKLPDAPEAKKVCVCVWWGGAIPRGGGGGGSDSIGQRCMMEVCSMERSAWDLWDHPTPQNSISPSPPLSIAFPLTPSSPTLSSTSRTRCVSLRARRRRFG